ncbi:MAG: zinc ABC transporter substrate-binding protein [Chloroflexi bacterium]|nr:zinc ABC transporter substrate-binding protein [Chloroflexota bacterium]
MSEMKKGLIVKACCLAALAVVLMGLLAGIACDSSTDSGKLKVVATILPLADFVKNVGGGMVEVTTLMSAGDSPHTWEPSPGQVKTIADARLMVINGAGLEFWMGKVIEAAASPDLVVVDTSVFPDMEGLLLTADEDGLGNDSEHGVNPHIWLDPLLAQQQVEAIAQALIMVDPGNKDRYLENATAFVAELESLDEEIRDATESFSIREFIAFHPAWTYFARRYGLVEAAVIEETPGRDSSAHKKEVIDLARALGIRAIFAEPQFNPQAAQSIADEVGAEVLFLDPMGSPDLPDRDSYIDLMRYNVEQMRLAMA